MKILRLPFVVGVLVAGAIFIRTSAAQDSPKAKIVKAPQGKSLSGLTPAMQILLARITADITRARYTEFLKAEFGQLDANSDGKLNQSDIALHEAMGSRQVRTSLMSTTMRMDVDGDGYVTEDEVRAVARYDLRSQLTMSSEDRGSQRLVNALQQIERTVQKVAELDVNKDGKVSYVEALKVREKIEREFADGSLPARVKHALTLADKGSKELPLVNFLAAGEAVFGKIDSDGDGIISQQELVDYWKGPTSPNATEKARAIDVVQAVQASKPESSNAPPVEAGCKIPAPSPKAKIIVLSSYETEALSTVTIGSQDQVVHAGRVTVEPGPDPIFLVITTSSALVWQLSGAVDRVERLVMSSHKTGSNEGRPDRPPLVGATGIPSERISFLSRSGCFGYFSELPSNDSINALRKIRKSLGREPDKVVAAYSVLAFSVPSGTMSSANAARNRAMFAGNSGGARVDGDASDTVIPGERSSLRDDFYRFSPGGIAKIEAKAVISSQPTQPYEVLPQQAGLIQLIGLGALKQNRTGEFIVQKSMRYPAGLHGAHAVHFLIPRGVPTPTGDPGHSCVNPEEGSPQGAICR